MIQQTLTMNEEVTPEPTNQSEAAIPVTGASLIGPFESLLLLWDLLATDADSVSKSKDDHHSYPDERASVCVCGCVCVRDREALLDSVPPWQHSLWARHRRQRKERESEDREEKEGGEEGREEEEEEQDMSVRLGVSRHRVEERRRQRSGGRTGSVSVIDIPPSWSEGPRGLSPLRGE